MSGENFEELESRIDALANIVSEQDSEIEELRAENEELRRRLADVEDATSMFRDISESSLTPQQRRRAVILFTLRNKAKQNAGKASMDAKECLSALNGEPDRTSMYDIMRQAAEYVESEAVRFVKEDRSARRNSRIEMDMDTGHVPERVHGQDITGQGVA